MATTYTLTDVTRNPSDIGRPQDIAIKLVDGGFRQVIGYYDSGVIVDEITFTSDDDGTFACGLIANSDISPTNTYYSIKMGLQPAVLIEATASGDVDDLLVTTPSALESPLTLDNLSDVYAPSPSDAQAIVWVDANSRWEIGDVEFTSPAVLTSNATGEIPLTLKGFAAQTASLQEWKDSADAVLARVVPDGLFTGEGLAFTTTGDATNSPAIRNNGSLAIKFSFSGTTYGEIATTGMKVRGVGTEATPAYRFSEGANAGAGMFAPSGKELALAADAREVLRMAGLAAGIPLVVKGAVAQTASYLEIQDSAAGVEFSLKPGNDGVIMTGDPKIYVDAQGANEFKIGHPTLDRGMSFYYTTSSGGSGASSSNGVWINSDHSILLHADQTIVRATRTDAPALVVEGNTGHTANLQEWRDTIVDHNVLAYIDIAGQHYGPDGLEATPAYSFLNSVDSGMYWNGSDRVSIAEGGTDVLELKGGGSNPLFISVKTGSTMGITFNTWELLNRRTDGNPALVRGNSDRNSGFGWFGNAPALYDNSIAMLQALTAVGVTAFADAATTPAFIAKGAAAQTADLQQWQDSTGAVRASMSADGRIFTLGENAGSDDTIFECSPSTFEIDSNNVGYLKKDGTIAMTWGTGGIDAKGLAVSGDTFMTGNNAAEVQLTVKGFTAQTASLQEWHDSAGVVLGTYGPDAIQSWARLDGTVRTKIDPEANTLWLGVGGGNTVIDVQNGRLLFNVGGTGDHAQFDHGIVTSLVMDGNQADFEVPLLVNNIAGPTAIPLTVKGAAAQTANLQEWTDSNDTVLAQVEPSGKLYSSVGVFGGGSGGYFSLRTNAILGITRGASDANFKLQVVGTAVATVSATAFTSQRSLIAQGSDATVVPVTVKGFAAQTANLQEWRDSTDTVLAKIDEAGVYGGGTWGHELNFAGAVAFFRIHADRGLIFGDGATSGDADLWARIGGDTTGTAGITVGPSSKSRLNFDNAAQHQTTVGSAGAADALPSAPDEYIKIMIEGTEYVIPAFAVS